jgi:transposase
METKTVANQRYALIHLLRSEKTLRQAARELGHPPSWAQKWKKRYEQEGWKGLEERSRRPNSAILEGMPFMDVSAQKGLKTFQASVRSSALSIGLE